MIQRARLTQINYKRIHLLKERKNAMNTQESAEQQQYREKKIE